MRLSLFLPITLALFCASISERHQRPAQGQEENEPDIIIRAPLELPMARLAAQAVRDSLADFDRTLARFALEVARVTLIDPGSLPVIELRNELIRFRAIAQGVR